MNEVVNEAIQERLEKESKELETRCSCREPSVEQRLEWAQRDFESVQRAASHLNTEVEALSRLYAQKTLDYDLQQEHVCDLRRENKKLNENAWKLKELLLDPENKIRMSKEMADKIFKLLP